MKDPRSFVSVLGLVAILGAARPAFAQAPAPPSAETLASAKTLFRQGVELFNAGDSERALDYFLRSRAAYPSAANATNAAICLDKLGRYDEALQMYEELLTRHTAEMSAQERQAVGPAMTALRGKVGSVEIVANVDGAVLVDGKARGKLPLSTAIRALPGKRTVRVTKEGYVTKDVTVEVAVGATAKVDVQLEQEKSPAAAPPPAAEAPPPPPTFTGRRIAGIVVGGVGVVGLGVGAAFGAMTLSAASNARSDMTLCPNNQCTPKGREAIDAASTKGAISTASFIVGAAAVTAGIVMVAIPTSVQQRASAVTVHPWAGPGGGGLGVAGAF